MMQYHHFPPGEEPEVLTCMSPRCTEGKHAECSGILSVRELRAMGAKLTNAERIISEGEIVFCVCPCHQKPGRS